MDTTEDFSVRFDAVADNPAIAVWANRRQRMNCALEAIKDVALSAHDDFKRLVVFVPANFASRHTQYDRARRGQWRCLFSVADGLLPSTRLKRKIRRLERSWNCVGGESAGSGGYLNPRTRGHKVDLPSSRDGSGK